MTFCLSFTTCILIVAYMGVPAHAAHAATPPLGEASIAVDAAEMPGANQISAGATHTCALTSTNGIKCWGSNYIGQLGDGTTVDPSRPVSVVGLTSGVSAVGTGTTYTCALTAVGGVKCWGDNYSGQLGDGSNNASSVPVDVVGLSNGVTAIAVGGDGACALMLSGGVKCWGIYTYELRGRSAEGISSKTPVDIAGLSQGVSAIGAGLAVRCAVLSDAVRCWGITWSGFIATTPITMSGLTSPASAIAVGGDNLCVLKVSGGIQCLGSNPFGESGGTLTNGVRAVSVGGNHTCVLLFSGGMKCWGNNAFGQLGDGTAMNSTTPVDVAGLSSGVRAIAAGSGFSCAVMISSGIKCWGRDAEGQLGNGAPTSPPLPDDVTGLTRGISAINSGGDRTCALTPAGQVTCWGLNTYGASQLISPVSEISDGYDHTCVLTTSGGVQCWGWNRYGQVGVDWSIDYLNVPTDVVGLTHGMSAVAAGSSNTCAVTVQGGVQCWGDNTSGQLGDGTTISHFAPADVSGLSSGVRAIAAGGGTVCVVMTSGGIKCWGNNNTGQLGDGTTTNRLVPVDVNGLAGDVSAVAVGELHTCALMTSGRVQCWGGNYSGQLGNGTVVNYFTPADVIGLASGVRSIVAGASHTCAVTVQGALKCWGDNHFGQIGNGQISQSGVLQPVEVSRLGIHVIAVSAGSYHTCALTTNGGVQCWGYNLYSQLGRRPPRTPVDVIGSVNFVQTWNHFAFMPAAARDW